MFAVGAARPEISQAQEIWQMTSVSPLNWRKIQTLSQLTPVQPFASATSTLTSQPVIFNGIDGTVGSRQAPFANPDADYTIYAVVAKTGTNVLDQQNWVTPLMNRPITANKTL